MKITASIDVKNLSKEQTEFISKTWHVRGIGKVTRDMICTIIETSAKYRDLEELDTLGNTKILLGILEHMVHMGVSELELED